MQRKILQRKIEFLHSLPLFAKMSRGGIQTLSHYFTEQKFKRGKLAHFNPFLTILGTYVFKENDKLDYIYIVTSGEFEATKEVTIQNRKEECKIIEDVIKTNQFNTANVKVQNERYRKYCMEHKVSKDEGGQK